jgi:hypothetical protein
MVTGGTLHWAASILYTTGVANLPTKRCEESIMKLRLFWKSCVTITPVLALALCLTGCGNDSVQEVNAPSAANKAADTGGGLSSAERLGLSGGQSAPASSGLDWEAPEGWEPQPTNAMRMANFKLGDSGECYVTILPGDGGGLLMNVNRWRTQMGLGALEDAGLASLPRLAMLGDEAVFVDFTGTYQGMRGDMDESDYRMMGALLEQDNQAVFVKMVGPSSLLEGEQEAFKAFCQSLELTEGGAPGAMADASGGDGRLPEGHPPLGNWQVDSAPGTTGGGQLPEGHPPVGGSASPQDGGQLPPDHPPLGGMPAPRALEDDITASLRWDAPEGWVRAGERPMRVVTYQPEDAPEAECYVTVLNGDGGGMERNLNRWREQMGMDPMMEADLAALPMIEVLGKQCPVLELTGDFTGMQGGTQEDQGMLGLVCLLDDQSVFVKMVGPKEAVHNARAGFEAFCKSLRLEDQSEDVAAASVTVDTARG